MRRRRRPIDLPALVERHLADNDPSGWFEPVYAAAGRDRRGVPWAHDGAHPYLVDWLDEPPVARVGPRAIVVGCGLGDDAAHLAARGLEVVAFDVSPSAIAWARRRHRRAAVRWEVADLLALPERWQGAFDLVVEVHTVPSLPGVVRDAAMTAIASLVADGGALCAVTRLATSSETASAAGGPPWPQAPSELATYRAGGLERVALEHPDPDETGVLEARLTFQRTGGGLPLA